MNARRHSSRLKGGQTQSLSGSGGAKTAPPRLLNRTYPAAKDMGQALAKGQAASEGGDGKVRSSIRSLKHLLHEADIYGLKDRLADAQVHTLEGAVALLKLSDDDRKEILVYRGTTIAVETPIRKSATGYIDRTFLSRAKEFTGITTCHRF